METFRRALLVEVAQMLERSQTIKRGAGNRQK
jgi:hypothetical protein